MKGLLKSQSIIPRIDGIQRDVLRLSELSNLSLEEFSTEDNFIKSQFYLRRALKGVFNVCANILSRLPGGRVTEYKSIALKLGESGIVEKNFANIELKDVTGYRNRLTHFYADFLPDEIFKIVKLNLSDFNTFLNFIKTFLFNLEKYNLSIE